MDKKFKVKIIQALRRLTFSYPPRTQAKALAKVAPATHECCKCGKYCYEGKSVKNFEKIQEQFPDKIVEMRTAEVDHIIPTVNPYDGFVNWDVYIKGMFCDLSNLQVICHDCHQIKTSQEKLLKTK